jgi:hypothetical protein
MAAVIMIGKVPAVFSFLVSAAAVGSAGHGGE